MLDGNHYQTAQLVYQLISNANNKATYDLIECLKPKLYVENGKYHYQCADAHIDVYGDTVFEAMNEFCKAFYNQRL